MSGLPSRLHCWWFVVPALLACLHAEPARAQGCHAPVKPTSSLGLDRFVATEDVHADVARPPQVGRPPCSQEIPGSLQAEVSPPELGLSSDTLPASRSPSMWCRPPRSRLHPSHTSVPEEPPPR